MNDYIRKIDGIARAIYHLGRYDDKKIINANAEYYKESMQSPAVARMVYKHSFNDCDGVYRALVRCGQESLREYTKRTVAATKNALIATNYEPAKSAYEAFEKKVEELYPHSWWIRSFTVDTNRIVPDKLSGQSGFFHKLKVGVFMKKHGIKNFFKA